MLKNYFLHVQNPIISSTALLKSATGGIRYATGLGIKSSYEESTGGLKDPLRPVLQWQIPIGQHPPKSSTEVSDLILAKTTV